MKASAVQAHLACSEWHLYVGPVAREHSVAANAMLTLLTDVALRDSCSLLVGTGSMHGSSIHSLEQSGACNADCRERLLQLSA